MTRENFNNDIKGLSFRCWNYYFKKKIYVVIWYQV